MVEFSDIGFPLNKWAGVQMGRTQGLKIALARSVAPPADFTIMMCNIHFNLTGLALPVNKGYPVFSMGLEGIWKTFHWQAGLKAFFAVFRSMNATTKKFVKYKLVIYINFKNLYKMIENE